MTLTHYLVVAAILFALGLYGALMRTNAIRILMSIELMLNAVNLNLVAFSRYITPDTARGQIFTIFVLTVAASEAAVGLAIILQLARRWTEIDVRKFNRLKW
ncbi:MAG: NADH-quinone oxidoreductase subunit NuoK [Firmicutes bacterium]|nr:NADH-quinone oxidoreductase subunit NuoK [Bacillota bacterium]